MLRTLLYIYSPSREPYILRYTKSCLGSSLNHTLPRSLLLFYPLRKTFTFYPDGTSASTFCYTINTFGRSLCCYPHYHTWFPANKAPQAKIWPELPEKITVSEDKIGDEPNWGPMKVRIYQPESQMPLPLMVVSFPVYFNWHVWVGNPRDMEQAC